MCVVCVIEDSDTASDPGVLMLIDIDTSMRGTLTKQIVNGVQRLVEERRLRFDTRLPSIRRFAAAHNISTFTVVQAYDRLVASGHVRSRPGSGFFVGKPASPAASDDGEGRLDEATDALWLMHRQTKDFEFKHLPGSGSMPSRWLADSSLAKAMRSNSRLGESGFIGRYANPRGFTRFARLSDGSCQRRRDYAPERRRKNVPLARR